MYVFLINDIPVNFNQHAHSMQCAANSPEPKTPDFHPITAYPLTNESLRTFLTWHYSTWMMNVSAFSETTLFVAHALILMSHQCAFPFATTVNADEPSGHVATFKYSRWPSLQKLSNL
jgi:hypothetical protein